MPTRPTHELSSSTAPSETVEGVARAAGVARGALRRMLEAVVSPDHPRGMARELGINRGLAWRVAKALSSPSASELLRALPRPKSMGVLLSACLSRGVSVELVERARQALSELEEAQAASGEDRRLIPVLLVASGIDGEQGAGFASSRQQLFEGARVLWGAEADLGLRLVIIWPGSTGELNGAVIRATIGLTALRPVPWTISYSRSVDQENREQQHVERPIDPAADAHASMGLPLLHRFCAPRPLDVRIDDSRGIRRYVVMPSTVGRAGEMTCVLGTWASDQFWESPRPEDTATSVMMIMETPMRRLQFDLLVHPALTLTRSSRVIFCDRLTRPHGFDRSRIEQERIPLDGEPEAMGCGVAAMAMARLPWYGDLLSHVSGRLQLDLDRFSGWRYELSYPPIATAALLQFWAARRAAGV